MYRPLHASPPQPNPPSLTPRMAASRVQQLLCKVKAAVQPTAELVGKQVFSRYEQLMADNAQYVVKDKSAADKLLKQYVFTQLARWACFMVANPWPTGAVLLLDASIGNQGAGRRSGKGARSEMGPGRGGAPWQRKTAHSWCFCPVAGYLPALRTPRRRRRC